MSADQGIVRMQPPDINAGASVTSVVSGRTYTCDPTAAIEVPVFDAPGLRAQGWIPIGEVASVAEAGSGGVPSTMSGAQVLIVADDGLSLIAGYVRASIGGAFSVQLGGLFQVQSNNDIAFYANTNIRLTGSQEVFIGSEDGPIRLSAHDGISMVVETGGVLLSAIGGDVVFHGKNNLDLNFGGYLHAQTSKYMKFTAGTYIGLAATNIHLDASTNILIHASGFIVYALNGFGVSASHAISMRTGTGGIYLSAGGTQGVVIQNKLTADSWPSADPSQPGQIWSDPTTDGVLKMSPFP